MKNMRGRFLRKIKSISNPTWKPGLVFQPNTSNHNLPEKHKNHHILPTLTTENLNLSEKLALPQNADIDEKITPSINSEEIKQHSSDSNAPDEDIVTSTHDHTIDESDVKDKCPPGGKDILVLYTTSLRGIRKTFEDCSTIRFLLESFRVTYSERDVSMHHLEYRHELWEILGGRVIPPRLFIKGRYIGGADEVVGLHEKGMLRNLLQGMPLISPTSCPCGGCGGMRFVLCLGCHGSRKVVSEGGNGNNGVSVRCPDCNENGLVKCSVCS